MIIIVDAEEVEALNVKNIAVSAGSCCRGYV